MDTHPSQLGPRGTNRRHDRLSDSAPLYALLIIVGALVLAISTVVFTLAAVL